MNLCRHNPGLHLFLPCCQEYSTHLFNFIADISVLSSNMALMTHSEMLLIRAHTPSPKPLKSVLLQLFNRLQMTSPYYSSLKLRLNIPFLCINFFQPLNIISHQILPLGHYFFPPPPNHVVNKLPIFCYFYNFHFNSK